MAGLAVISTTTAKMAEKTAEIVVHNTLSNKHFGVPVSGTIFVHL